MKEIKFRAWRKDIEVMYPVLKLDFVDEKATIWSKFTGNSYEWIDDLVIMQYTGLKDKYGVEIYEGDILELRANPFNKKRDLFQVVFKYGGFRDEWNNYIGQCLPPDIRNKQGGRVRLNEACEVVGNIYENPELLQ